MQTDRTSHSPQRAQACHMVGLLGIVAVAFAVRFWALDVLPPGLYRDEATNGLDALRVLAGERPIYFTANNGREPLFIYLLAASIRLFGRTPGALRAVSALSGVITVLCSYWLGRVLYGKRAGLLLAALMASSVWAVNLSRIGFRAVTLPMVSAALLACLWRGLEQRNKRLMVAAGILWGLSFYTYLAARFTLIALPLLCAYLNWTRPQWRWHRGWLLMAAVALLVAAPLLYYIATHWQATMGRASQVSILNPAINGGHLWGTLAGNLWRTLLGPFVRGDFIPRHNIPCRPALGWVMAPLGLVGAVLVLGRWRRDAAAGLIVIWCASMALPTVLAENAPHFLRAVGVLPVLYLLPVVALEWIDERLQRFKPIVGPIFMAGMALLSGIIEMQAYFAHLHSEAVYYNYEAGVTELATRINAYLGTGWTGQGLAVAKQPGPSDGAVALDKRLPENWPALSYLVPESERLVRLDQVGDLASPSAVVVWPYGDLDIVVESLPKRAVIDVRPGAWQRGDLETEATMLYTWIESGSEERPERRLDATWANGIVLDGYTIRRGEGEIELTLWWHSDAPIKQDYSVFCQAMSRGLLVGQSDGPPALGLLPTSRWHLYDAIIDRRSVSVDNDSVADAMLHIGLYDLATMQRVGLLEKDGSPAEMDYMVLE